MKQLTPADLGFGRLFATIRDAVVVAEAATGRIVLWNPAASAMLGYSDDEVVGQDISLLVPERLREQHQRGLAGYARTGHGRFIDAAVPIELPARCRDGSEIMVDVTLSAIEDPAVNERFVMAVLHDVTTRKQAEDELRRLADTVSGEIGRYRLMEILKQAPAAVAVTRGPEHVFDYVNPLFVQAAGRTDIHEFLGKPARFALPEVDRSYAELMNRAYASGEVQTLEEALIRLNPLGTDHATDAYFNLLVQPVRDGNGEVDGVFVYAVDITAQVQARRAAERESQLREQFLAAAAHDLRTPMTSVKGLVQLLQRRLSRDPLPEPARQTIEDIGVATQRMSRLIDQILDVASLDMERAFELDLSAVDLIPPLHSLVAAARPLHPMHDVELVTALPQLVGRWDGPRLERVMANLLDNAVKYSPTGGAVTVSLSAEDGWAVIVVKDHGMGIPPGEQTKVFERFGRGSNVRDKKIAGTGMGLAYARHVTQQHGGTISVESQEGVGSTFTVRIPLAPPPPPGNA